MQRLRNIVYLRPPDHPMFDQSSNYISPYFKGHLQEADFTLHELPVEIPGIVGTVESYNGSPNAACRKVRSDMARKSLMRNLFKGNFSLLTHQ